MCVVDCGRLTVPTSCCTDVRYSCCDLFTTFPIVAHQFARTKGHGYGRGSGPPRPRLGRGLVTSARLHRLIQPAHTVVFLQPQPPSCPLSVSPPPPSLLIALSFSSLLLSLSLSLPLSLSFGDVRVGTLVFSDRISYLSLSVSSVHTRLRVRL